MLDTLAIKPIEPVARQTRVLAEHDEPLLRCLSRVALSGQERKPYMIYGTVAKGGATAKDGHEAQSGAGLSPNSWTGLTESS